MLLSWLANICFSLLSFILDVTQKQRLLYDIGRSLVPCHTAKGWQCDAKRMRIDSCCQESSSSCHQRRKVEMQIRGSPDRAAFSWNLCWKDRLCFRQRRGARCSVDCRSDFGRRSGEISVIQFVSALLCFFINNSTLFFTNDIVVISVLPIIHSP